MGAYNAFDDGDACCVGTMANSALYMHYPLPKRFKQNNKPTVASLHAQGYLQADGTVARPVGDVVRLDPGRKRVCYPLVEEADARGHTPLHSPQPC